MTAQELLTIAAETVLLGSIALYTALFIDGLMARPRRVSPGQLSLFDVQPAQNLNPQETGDLTIAAPAPEQPRYEVVILPFKRRSQQPQAIASRYGDAQRQTIDLSGMTIRQLKAIASAVKLPRYNVEPKANLQARLLAEVPHDRLMQALEVIAA